MIKHLDFREIERECREKYKKSPLDYDWSDKNKEFFFRDKQHVFTHYIKLIIDEEYTSLQEMKLEWILMGDFFELLIKISLLKENWTNLGLIYNYEKKGFYGLEISKQILIDSLKNKLDKKQLKRAREILDFIQLQRNNFIHNPISGSGHYAIETQCLKLILALYKLYSLNFNKEDIQKIKDKIEYFEKNNSGMDFEEVNLI